MKAGKISNKAIKDFLKNYFEGDPDCQGCPTGCKEPNECYIHIHLALFDDNGVRHKFGEPYHRDDTAHCCGKPLNTLDQGKLFCSVCGTEH